MSSPEIFYYYGRYAMIKSIIPAPPGATIFKMLEDAMIPKPDKRKKPTKLKEGELLMCPSNSENIKTRRDA